MTWHGSTEPSPSLPVCPVACRRAECTVPPAHICFAHISTARCQSPSLMQGSLASLRLWICTATHHRCAIMLYIIQAYMKCQPRGLAARHRFEKGGSLKPSLEPCSYACLNTQQVCLPKLDLLELGLHIRHHLVWIADGTPLCNLPLLPPAVPAAPEQAMHLPQPSQMLKERQPFNCNR